MDGKSPDPVQTPAESTVSGVRMTPACFVCVQPHYNCVSKGEPLHQKANCITGGRQGSLGFIEMCIAYEKCRNQFRIIGVTSALKRTDQGAQSGTYRPVK